MAQANKIEEQEELSDNILWITDNTDGLSGFQEIYHRIHELEREDKVPWILLNISCEGSEDSDYSAAVLSMLKNCKKPIKTQIMTKAFSYGLVYACVGEERVGWPDSCYMHHSFHIDARHTSTEDLEFILSSIRKSEKKILEFMKKQMGQAGLKEMMKDFKTNGHKDLYFDVQAALKYNIIQKVGFIEPLYF